MSFTQVSTLLASSSNPYGDKSRRGGEPLLHVVGSKGHQIAAILAAAKRYYCSKNERLNKPAPLSHLADITGIPEDKVFLLVSELAEGRYLKLEGNSIVFINSNAFRQFKVIDKNIRQLLKESRALAYKEQAEFPRLPRVKIINDQKLVVKKSPKHEKGLNLNTGNRCGHSKEVLPTFVWRDDDMKRPNCVSLAVKILPDFYMQPELLPEIRVARECKSRSGKSRKQRSEGREAVVLLLTAILSRMDVLTMRVGKPFENDFFRGIKLASLAEIAGISFTRAERAMAVLIKARYITSIEVCEKLEDGTYQGYAAIRTVSVKLFKRLGLGKELLHDREYMYKRQLKRDFETRHPEKKYEPTKEKMQRIEDEFRLAAELTDHAPQHLLRMMTNKALKGF